MHSIVSITGSTRTDGEGCENSTYIFLTNITNEN